ncbi:hypothetical protein [Streptococcus sobrinus]|uniref:hypothetical protein n=1 Tax=Streptococcus sobrinus TaxID=1310 RepID=UPI0002DCE459|nr:hypothetical protein [Streptococcus sobrinus]AWN18774.1 hypothetical protein DK181_04700 [Streptococcus sobrinus]
MNNDTNTAGLKKLAFTNGLIGIIGPILSFFIRIIGLAMVSSKLAKTGHTLTQQEIFSAQLPVYLISAIPGLIVLILGIVALVKFRKAENNTVSLAAHILLIVGGALSIVFGIFGEIPEFIGGILYLTSLKKFDQPQFPNQNIQQ